jgi:hypothetical protein
VTSGTLTTNRGAALIYTVASFPAASALNDDKYGIDAYNDVDTENVESGSEFRQILAAHRGGSLVSFVDSAVAVMEHIEAYLAENPPLPGPTPVPQGATIYDGDDDHTEAPAAGSGAGPAVGTRHRVTFATGDGYGIDAEKGSSGGSKQTGWQESDGNAMPDESHSANGTQHQVGDDPATAERKGSDNTNTGEGNIEPKLQVTLQATGNSDKYKDKGRYAAAAAAASSSSAVGAVTAKDTTTALDTPNGTTSTSNTAAGKRQQKIVARLVFMSKNESNIK